LDEVQNLPQVTKVIKFLLDHYKVKFIVTGSSSFYLKNLFPESLSGRKFLYELPPLTFREFLYFKDILTRRQAKTLFLTKKSSILGEVEHYRRENYYREYLDFLQGTFFIRLIPKFSRSIDRSVAGGKKIYFTDTGILNTIGSVNAGQLLENAVMNQLVDYGKISFYNQRNTAEIDAIIDNKIAMEIKLTGTKQDMFKLKKLAGKLKIKKLWVVSQRYREGKEFVSPVFI